MDYSDGSPRTTSPPREPWWSCRASVPGRACRSRRWIAAATRSCSWPAPNDTTIRATLRTCGGSRSTSPRRGARDVWVMDPARGTTDESHDGARIDFAAFWMPDGGDLLYTSERPLFELYRRAADGSPPPSLLLGGAHDRVLGSISAEGRIGGVRFFRRDGPRALDGAVTRDADAEAVSREAGVCARATDRCRPMAAGSLTTRMRAVGSRHTSSRSDPTLAKHRISSGGGSEPIWTQGGREVVFVRGDSVMAATVDPVGGSTGIPTLLFAGQFRLTARPDEGRRYDVSPDGQRFLLLKWPAGEARRRVLVTRGWWAELRGGGGRGCKAMRPAHD